MPTEDKERSSENSLEDFSIPTSGSEFILHIEDLYTRQISDKIEDGTFWVNMVKNPESVSESIFIGFCVENYHLLFRESYFDSPILPYPNSTRIRELVNGVLWRRTGPRQASLEIS